MCFQENMGIFKRKEVRVERARQSAEVSGRTTFPLMPRAARTGSLVAIATGRHGAGLLRCAGAGPRGHRRRHQEGVRDPRNQRDPLGRGGAAGWRWEQGGPVSGRLWPSLTPHSGDWQGKKESGGWMWG